MNAGLKIKYITDSWTAILLFNNCPVVLFWYSKRQGGPSIYKVLRENKLSEELYKNLNIEELYIFQENTESLMAKYIGKSYEFYLEPTQRHYSNFHHLFNSRNNEFMTIPIIDKEFYSGYDRVFNWEHFSLTQKIENTEVVMAYENLLKSGEKPYVLIYQNYISQNGTYEDGSNWKSVHVSPFFVLSGNHLFQAYRNLNIPPNFILKTEKIKGNKLDEFKGNEILINGIVSKYLNKEETELIDKYR